MEDKTNKTINLPRGNIIKPKDDKVCDKIFRKLMRKFLFESVNDYFNKSYIDYKLDRIIKIEMDKKPNYLGDTIYEDRILKLPKFFFTTEIKKTDDVLNLMSKYPALKNLLTTYAIYVVGYNYNNRDSKEDKVIKNIIATYLATEKNGNKLTEITKANMTFKSYATSHALLENIIREIALIIGKDKLYETLQYGTEVLTKEIDEKTRKKGLGESIVNNLVKLNKLSTTERWVFYSCNVMQSITDTILMPMYEQIEKYDINYQNTILNLIQMKDFDFSILKSIDENIDLTKINKLDEHDKAFIKSILNHFDKSWRNYRCLVTGYPETKIIRTTHGDGRYEKEDAGKNFTFLNKFFSVHTQSEYEYYKLTQEIISRWESTQELIILELIPRYIKYNKDANINLEQILELSRYTTKEKEYDISTKNRKVRIIEKKLNKVNN